MGDLLFHGIEAENELFVTGDPVNDRIGHVLQIFGLLLAHLDISLGLLLQSQGELAAPRDALATQLKALVRLLEGPRLRVVEAVHAAACRLVIHDVEFLVQERVEADLSLLHSLVQVLEDLLVHVSHSVFVVLFVKPEEVSELLLALSLWVEVHVELLLQVLPGARVLRLPPVKALSGLIKLLV